MCGDIRWSGPWGAMAVLPRQVPGCLLTTTGRNPADRLITRSRTSHRNRDNLTSGGLGSWRIGHPEEKSRRWVTALLG